MTRAKQLQGEQVRLIVLKSSSDDAMLARWAAAAKSWRLLDATADAHAPDQLPVVAGVYFQVLTRVEERPIGHAGLFSICPVHRDAWVNFDLGDPTRWDWGIGVDVLRMVLCYGFSTLGLRRIALGVFDYDARRMRAYEDAGFAIEGRVLEETNRGVWSRAGVVMGAWREMSTACVEHEA
jgi:RimJ/RimL family protein N-acetyltransferase